MQIETENENNSVQASGHLRPALPLLEGVASRAQCLLLVRELLGTEWGSLLDSVTRRERSPLFWGRKWVFQCVGWFDSVL